MLQKAEDLAYGRWPEVLQAAGVDSSYFGKKAGPCPLCPGGTDRYIWQDKNGGRYLCRYCTEARYRGGMDFLMRLRGFTFREAADFVREHFNATEPVSGNVVVPRLAPIRKEVIDVEARRATMDKIWSYSRPVRDGDPVDRYLRRRVPGMGPIPAQIHLHPALGYWEAPDEPGGKPVLLGEFPAMLVRGFDAAGKLVQLHKTYLTPDGQKAPVPYVKKTDRGVGCNSFALRLEDPEGDTLGVCEGIETALSATVMEKIPVWPCHSADILANFEIPEHLRGQIKRLWIFADYDHVCRGIRKGTHCAAKLSDRMRHEGVRTMILRPAKAGKDMNDLLLAA